MQQGGTRELKQKILHDCSRLIIAQTLGGSKKKTKPKTTKQCLALKPALFFDPEAPALLPPRGGERATGCRVQRQIKCQQSRLAQPKHPVGKRDELAPALRLLVLSGPLPRIHPHRLSSHPYHPFLRLPSFRLWNLPLPTGSASLSSPCSDCTEGQSPCMHRSYLRALLPLSAARCQHTGGSEASRSLPRTGKPSGLLMLLRCLCAGQRQESGARRAKLLAASKEVLQDAPYPRLRLDAGRHPASQRAAQLGWEGGAATLHPCPVQTWEKEMSP